MPETPKMNDPLQEEPDYSRSLSDWMLERGKSLISNPETRHDGLSRFASISSALPPKYSPHPILERFVHFHDRSLPIRMASPIMLAAGANKYGINLPAFASLGFGAVTVGSATREARLGNPARPRIGMLPLDRAMSNSMGLPNPGIDALAAQVDSVLGQCHKRRMSVGISVADSPELEDGDEKIRDLVATFRKAYRAADYIELNVSCPNTGSDRLDTYSDFLAELLDEIMEIRKSLAPRKAVLVKLSPDLGSKALEGILRTVSDAGITGLVLFNTFPATRAKYLNLKTPEADIPILRADGSKGGLSGRPLYQNTLPAVRFIHKELPHLTLIASGGVDSGQKALDLLEAGADAVQCYTVLAYRWQAVRKMNKELVQAMATRGLTTLEKDPLP